MRIRQCGLGPALFASLFLLPLFLNVPSATAGITGSAHDFTGAGVQDRRTGAVGPLDRMGACSACHIPHWAVDLSGLIKTLPPTYGFPYLLWPRNLSDEADYFDQYDSDPVYLSAPTLMCYDCHENQANEVENPVDPDNWPTNSIYGSHASGTPQDIALDDYDEENKLPRSQGSGDVGYYEMLDGSLPASPAQSDATGGHYWKRTDANLSGTPEVKQGEKLSCALCHDVHDIGTQQVTGESQAMFRTEYWDGSSWNTYPVGNIAYGQTNGALYSSTNTRAHGDESPGGNNHGRNLCSACHGYSDQGAAVDMYGDTIPSPPPFSFHSTGSTTACTSCHQHNKLVFRCDQCHGFPPLVEAAHDPDTVPNGQSYSGGAGAHQRHQDALGTDIFKCEICHGPHAGVNEPNLPTPEVWHNEGGGTVSRDKVDIMGESAYWDPAGTLTTAYVGTQTGAVADVPTGYEFTAKGADDGGGTGGRCDNLECHGRPPATEGALNWNDDMVDADFPDLTPSVVEIDICKWCHDETTAMIGTGTPRAPNMMGTERIDLGTGGDPTTATNFGAEVNGHGLSGSNYDSSAVGQADSSRAGAAKECTVCHDATYASGTGPARIHFGDKTGQNAREVNRLQATINGEPVPDSDSAPDTACVNCHQKTTGSDDGTQISSHGNSNPGYTALEGAFTRVCRQCHEPHGLTWNGTNRNIYMVGKWLDTNSDGARDSGEEARVDSDAVSATANITSPEDNTVIFTSRTGVNSFNDKGGTPTDDICMTCHAAGTGGGDHTQTPGYGGDERENDCTVCHDHDYDDDVANAWDAFMPFGAPDIEQFHDSDGTGSSYNDVSRHPIVLASLTYADAPNCIGCHKKIGGSSTSNECLKCHYEGYVDTTPSRSWVWSGHADGNQTLELRTASSPAPPYDDDPCNPGTDCISINRRTTTAAVVDHCLLCHDGTRITAPYQLDSQNPPDVVPAGSTWTGGFGHGSSTTLSSERSGAGHNAGPPAYDCRACHFSTVVDETDDPWPGFHASINDKLVANTTGPYQTSEYTDWSTGQGWCLTQCHRTVATGKQVNGDNSVAKDDKVIDHTWAPDNAESADQTDCPLSGDPTQGICETHPSWATIDDSGGLYQLPSNIPYDTGSDQFFCISCHEPHGDSTASDADQMIRFNYSDSTLCDECHL